MRSLGAVLRELAGLFVEDGALAAAISLVLACAAAVAQAEPLAAGVLLLLGCLGVLFGNALRAGGPRARR